MSGELSYSEVAVLVADAIADERQRCAEIAQLCRICGYPELAAQEIRSGASFSEIRQRLQQRRPADDIMLTQERDLDAELRAAAEERFKAQAGVAS